MVLANLGVSTTPSSVGRSNWSAARSMADDLAGEWWGTPGMGYAGSSNAAGPSGPQDAIARRRHAGVYQGANANLRPPAGSTRQASPRQTLHRLIEGWSLESFQRERAVLDEGRARQATSLAGFVRSLYAPADDDCRRMAVLAARQAGGPQELARDLLGPAARQIGDDWLNDDANFLRVTIASARLQLLFREACAACPPPRPRDPTRRLLLAPAPGNQHGLGIAVIEDAFRRDGWIVDAGLSGDDLLRQTSSVSYHIIGLAVGADRDLHDLEGFTRLLRSRSKHPAVALMAGGNLAATKPQALIAAGFDCVCEDAATAVRHAARVAAAGVHGLVPF